MSKVVRADDLGVTTAVDHPAAHDAAVARAAAAPRKIVLLTVVMWAVSCLAMLLLAGPQHWAAPSRWSVWIALPALALAFALTEIFVVHLRVKADAHTFSLVELPLAFGLFFVQPFVVIGAQLLGATVALVLHRKQRGLKLLFNTASLAVTTVVAIAVFRLIAPDRALLDQATLLKGAASLLVESCLAIALVFLVISISAGSWRAGELRSSLGFGLVTSTFTASLGIIGVVLLDAKPSVAWLLIVPTAGTYLANWAYTNERRRHEGLDFLYRSTQLLHESTELDTAIAEMLEHVRSTFNAEAAELVYLAEASDTPVCIRISPEHAGQTLHPVDVEHESLVGSLDSPHALILSMESSHPTAQFLRQRGYRDAIVAPLRSDGRAIGALVVANRLSQVVNFSAADAVLAETLASQTATALENGRLEQSLDQLRVLESRLTFQALHDPLTSLANRTLFQRDLGRVLDGQDQAAGAVLFIDLDDFKTVNDSFGHETGDALLVEVADRLRRAVGSRDTAARLGGDEFAVLLPSVSTSTTARRRAERILAALEAPAVVAQRHLAIRASIGIAMVEPGADADQLLRSADTAMYTAKAQGKHRIVMFDPSTSGAIGHRSDLHVDLQEAVASRSLSIHLQPIVHLATREFLGAEALVRWQHPELGLLTPESFLPLAEKAGMIAALDMVVLDRACEFLARADVAGDRVVPWVNVNLSQASFQEPGLFERVAAALCRHDLTPDRLGIEISEELITERVDGLVETLERIRAVGVRLSLDDFGTGHSSFDHLKTLPVDSVKIAKPFIDDLESSESQRVFASTIITLGTALHKLVVAEGVERPEQRDFLAACGCDAAQGHLFARPMDEDSFLVWARHWMSTTTESVSPLAMPTALNIELARS
jgi:diguanylate cyclase (GGDEF)-like protein